MKCDELHVASLFEFEKVLKGKSNKLFYAKADVDVIIANLKAENERLEKFIQYIKDDANKIRCYAQSLNKEHRLTKRALWMARALSANHAANFCYYIAHYGKTNKVKKIYQDQDKWDKIEELCIKKAEEYK